MARSRRRIRDWATAGLLALGAAFLMTGEVASDQVTLTTYYPAPSGVYTQMITTDRTWLARDAGGLSVGTTDPAPAGVKLLVGGGGFQLRDGTQAPGRVLTSDVNGRASWQDNNGHLYAYRCTGNKLNTDYDDEAWCGPNLPPGACVAFVIYQNQTDNDLDEVQRAGCFLQNNRLYFHLHTSGDDHENTAMNSICGAICGLPVTASY